MRMLNELVPRDAYPLPRQEDIFAKISDNRCRTGIVTHRGHEMFTLSPMGYKRSVQHQQNLMDSVEKPTKPRISGASSRSSGRIDNRWRLQKAAWLRRSTLVTIEEFPAFGRNLKTAPSDLVWKPHLHILRVRFITKRQEVTGLRSFRSSFAG
ncbi:uncharacterized protein H6S33_007123 [Morchella sextelata]|uniref:uncharacterized protein n=1 Tax=Morchella sextelata TaxID=1174677 RepID=UPI001D054094|nr:uncharacterized protein H6S33_007123 [Morchella sextelata]KAH0604092.1 hypothetical protein H6S33_007123 [Morchella sextelata]